MLHAVCENRCHLRSLYLFATFIALMGGLASLLLLYRYHVRWHLGLDYTLFIIIRTAIRSGQGEADIITVNGLDDARRKRTPALPGRRSSPCLPAARRYRLVVGFRVISLTSLRRNAFFVKQPRRSAVESATLFLRSGEQAGVLRKAFFVWRCFCDAFALSCASSSPFGNFFL